MKTDRPHVMILGGGENQVPFIRRAKACGYRVVLCDFRENVPGVAICDEFCHANAMNPAELVAVGRARPVSGIVTNSEPLFRSMSVAAKALGLRGMSEEQTELFKDKWRMREFCAQHGIDSPRFRRCETPEEALAFFREVKGKCILKPLDSSGSRGVHSVESEEDVLRHFGDSLQANLVKAHAAVLAEEYVTGTEFTVDGLMTTAGHRCLAISEKRHYPYNENVACELRFEPTNDRFDYGLLRRTVDRLVNRIGVTFCLTHAELKFADGRFWLIEIQARGGGAFISTDIVPFVSGVDPTEAQLRWSVEGRLPAAYDYAHLPERCAVLNFFDVPGKGGVVKDILGLDRLAAFGDRLQYHLNFGRGDVISRTKDDTTRIGWYIALAENRFELSDMMRTIDRDFHIVV